MIKIIKLKIKNNKESKQNLKKFKKKIKYL